MIHRKGILDSSLVARIGETVTLRDQHDKQVAIFTHIRTEQGGRRKPDDVAKVAPLCAAAPDGAALAELVMDYCGNPSGISEGQQDELYEVALQFMKKARGEQP